MDFLKRRNRNRTSFPFRYAKELGFGLLAVAAVVIALLALTMRDNGVSASPAPSTGAPQAARPTVPNIDIIGDSYVGGSDEGGYGAANWTKIVGSRFYSESRPVDMNVTAVPGGGYITRGPDKATFAEAATTNLRSSADLVLVFGSRNDGKQDAATMAAAATDLYAKIRERAPHAKLIVVGPAWVNENVPDFITGNTRGDLRCRNGRRRHLRQPPDRGLVLRRRRQAYWRRRRPTHRCRPSVHGRKDVCPDLQVLAPGPPRVHCAITEVRFRGTAP